MECRRKSIASCYEDNYISMCETHDGYKNLVKDVCAYVTLYRPKMFRWNVSGDIFSGQYLKAMYTITEQCPDCQFYVFTKQC
jgi:hypothetical protein